MTKVFSTNTIGQTIDQWKSSGARWQASKLAKCMISKKTMTLTYSKCNKFLESFRDVFENLISLRFSSSVSNWFIFWTEITKNWHWGNDAICLARKFMSDPIMKCLWWIFVWPGSGPVHQSAIFQSWSGFGPWILKRNIDLALNSISTSRALHPRYRV